ncbi:hypothetical protein D3C87_1805770 [compost metagenome]
MSLLLLFPLLLDRVAVMFQRLAGVKVLFFQRADLLILLLHANFQVTAILAQAGIAGELGLQACLTNLQLIRLKR